MANPSDIVQQYLDAFYGVDGRDVRRFLADDLTFAGPAARFSGADAYLRASGHARRAARGVDVHKVFADGPEVGVFYDLFVEHPASPIAVAEWYRLEGERIVSIRTVFDTAPFVAAGEPAGETAVDPVCRMPVRPAAAPASRTYLGDRYFFCSPGCAEAFEQEPERYLAPSR
jgi:YHS domain-containing protein